MMKIQTISTKIGAQSLIGTGNNFPIRWGNYFWFAEPKGGRCCNMWAENLEYLNLPDVKVATWEGTNEIWSLIIDERVPSEFKYEKPYFCGCARPPLEIAREMYEVLGQPDSPELEEWTDPKSYWKKKGHEYEVLDDGTAIIKYNVIPKHNEDSKITYSNYCTFSNSFQLRRGEEE